MAAPIKSFVFKNSAGTSRTFSTSFNDSVGESNITVVSTQGIFEGGENDAEARERTYSNGSVLAPTPRYKGRDFTIEFLIYSRDKRNFNLLSAEFNLISFMKSSNLTLTTGGILPSMTVQMQRAENTTADFGGFNSNGVIVVKFYFKANI